MILQLEDPSVPLLARPRRDCLLCDHCLHDLGPHHRLDLEAWPQRDVDRRAPILLGVPAPGTTALDLRESHARNAAFVEHGLNFLEPFVAGYRYNPPHAAATP